MGRFKRIVIIHAALIAAGAVSAAGREPAWILLERGKAAFDERDLTAALDFLLDAVDAEDEFPEAEYWLGRVYAAGGQSILAEQQYRRAMDLSIFLRVPEERFEITYSLADLLLQLGPERRSEARALLSGIADAEGASSPAEMQLEHRYVDVLIQRGLDELIYLYRDPLGVSLRARRIMGELAWEEGRYRSSLLHSSRTVLALLSAAAEHYRGEYPEWRFDIDAPRDELNPDRDVRYPGDTDGTASLLIRIEQGNPDIPRRLERSGFWAQLYLLSVSLYAQGHSEPAASLWRLMAPPDSLDGSPSPLPAAGTWGILASAQLNEPFISRGSLTP